MTRYGFLIDQDTCIGCHACTVACKSEHDVPIGVNRTWVKYIEKGAFPEARRYFSVMRCNHCEDAPCVSICPTSALFTRKDGIVDFDDSRCIGCKSCMNACPYDAIYINPETDTAHKCNFCSHRVEVGLEPSCVVVCPTQSIFAGDLDDPTSRISVMISRNDTKVRAPEQGTRPKLFYKGADEASLDPLRTKIAADGMIWADTKSGHPTLTVDPPGHGTQVVARTAYTTEHPAPWKALVSAYLVTKAVSAGALLAGALAVVAGHSGERSFIGIFAPLVALLFAGVTGLLLVTDLKQPRRFLYIFTKPQWRSWLVRGAFILLGYGGLAGLWFLAGLLDSPGLIQVLAIPTALFAAGTAGYTAFLFGQCEGRDMWQTPLLLPILLAQAGAAGCGVLLIGEPLFDLAEHLTRALQWGLVGSLGVLAAMIAIELLSNGTVHVETAQRAMTHGPHARRFWALGIAVGILVPAVATIVALVSSSSDVGSTLGVVAGITTIVGMYGYEDAFVRAGQSVPLS